MIRNLLYNLFSILPIQSKKILFFSYYGAQYGGNPKYISQYIIENEKDLKVIWAMNDMSKINDSRIKKVKYASFGFLFEMATSGTIITNYRLTKEIPKRKNQIYIQTWHSSLRLKMIEKDAIDSLSESYIEMAKSDSKKIDYLLSGCADSKKIFEQSFWYQGKILETGTPRIDPLINPSTESIQNIRNQLGVLPHEKVVLYAPTFREKDNSKCYIKNFRQIVKSLESEWGGKWRVMARLHPHLMNKAGEIFEDDTIIQASKYPDVQELLMVADFLITDYSSLMFDFLYSKKPVLLYLPDLDSYLKNERGLYYKIDELPFLKANNNNEIVGLLNNFDENLYQSEIESFIKKIGSFENGNASQKLIEVLRKKIK